MNNKTEFIKLLLIAILCHTLIFLGLTLMKLSVLFESIYIENGAFGLGSSILIFTIHYVSQHELKRRIKAMHDNWFVYRYKL